MADGPVRFAAFCGCNDSREVWISLASMPAAFSATSNLPIAALLTSDASRAVLASEVTPASISARSGGTRSRLRRAPRSPEGSRCLPALVRRAGQRRKARRTAATASWGLLERHVDVDHELVLRRLQ